MDYDPPMAVMKRSLGSCGIEVSLVGLGAGRIGDPRQEDAAIERLLHGALDRGVTLIDTARSYGLSEERIGRLLASRRSAYVLSTKVGYGVEGVADWTNECIRRGVDEALRRLRTDWLDLVFLHSCALDVLERGEVLAALQEAKRAGKVRAIGYAGENEALAWALDSTAFDVIQCSVNLADQTSLEAILPNAEARGVGVIAKRSLANAAFTHAVRPAAPDVAAYFDRLRTLALDPRGIPWAEFALRFTAFAWPVASAIVGTSRLEGLDAALTAAQRGPLPAEHFAEIRAAFRDRGAGWGGIV